jgi:lipopolysaccharide export system protein LptA
VVVVQGKNVARGDKMIIDRKTNHTTLISNATGRNNPNRVRGVFYNQNGQGAGQTGSTPATPAKKP